MCKYQTLQQENRAASTALKSVCVKPPKIQIERTYLLILEQQSETEMQRVTRRWLGGWLANRDSRFP